MDALFAWAVELGAEEAWVATEADNTPALVLYERLGAKAAPMAYFEYELD